jgi:phi LC3 family holin
MINWKVRFKDWLWVSSFISQILIVVQVLLVGLNAVGWTDFQLTEAIKGWFLALANAVFILLSMLGIVKDPTVEGVGDSQRALARQEPLSKNSKKYY